MMSDSKQQFSSNFLSNDLNSDFAKSNSARENSAKLKSPRTSGSLLDGVAVFPDGSVMWVPDSDATGDEGTVLCEKDLLYVKHLPVQSYAQNRNHHSSSAIALIKRIVRWQMLSFQRVLR
jgi:hypothetical protein